MKTYVYEKKRYMVFFFIFTLLFCVLSFFLIYAGGLTKSLHASEEPTSSQKRITVVIDAGHGGEDCGAIGVNGVYEKDINLNISIMLYDILRANGIDAVLTRSEDILLYDRNSNYHGQKKVQDLAARRKITEECENPIFISVHMNAFPEEKYSGLQVYYSTNHILSKDLSDRITKTSKDTLLPTNERLPKAAGDNIYLLDRLPCPAVLVECGFLSNAEECEKLSEEEYQKQMALCLAAAIGEYLEANT